MQAIWNFCFTANIWLSLAACAVCGYRLMRLFLGLKPITVLLLVAYISVSVLLTSIGYSNAQGDINGSWISGSRTALTLLLIGTMVFWNKFPTKPPAWLDRRTP